jgi:hypothetical protein
MGEPHSRETNVPVPESFRAEEPIIGVGTELDLADLESLSIKYRTGRMVREITGDLAEKERDDAQDLILRLKEIVFAPPLEDTEGYAFAPSLIEVSYFGARWVDATCFVAGIMSAASLLDDYFQEMDRSVLADGRGNERRGPIVPSPGVGGGGSSVPVCVGGGCAGAEGSAGKPTMTSARRKESLISEGFNPEACFLIRLTKPCGWSAKMLSKAAWTFRSMKWAFHKTLMMSSPSLSLERSCKVSSA